MHPAEFALAQESQVGLRRLLETKHVNKLTQRLFVGNLHAKVTEKYLRSRFSKFGEVLDCFSHPNKTFAFVQLGSMESALKAQAALDGALFEGKPARVRQAPHHASVWVSNLHPTVSNELLYNAFRQFGDIDRAVVFCDERGRSKGYGCVDFTMKPSARRCVDRCKRDFLLLSRSFTPVHVAFTRPADDATGLLARTLTNYPGVEYELSAPFRFATKGHLEHTFCRKWEKLLAEERRAKNDLKQELISKRRTLEQEQSEAMKMEENRIRQQQAMEIEREEERRRRFGPPAGPPPFGYPNGSHPADYPPGNYPPPHHHHHSAAPPSPHPHPHAHPGPHPVAAAAAAAAAAAYGHGPPPPSPRASHGHGQSHMGSHPHTPHAHPYPAEPHPHPGHPHAHASADPYAVGHHPSPYDTHHAQPPHHDPYNNPPPPAGFPHEFHGGPPAGHPAGPPAGPPAGHHGGPPAGHPGPPGHPGQRRGGHYMERERAPPPRHHPY